MDLTIERRNDEATLKRRFRKVFFVVNGPIYVRLLLVVALFLQTGLIFPNYRLATSALALFFFTLFLSFYPRTWRIVRDAYRKTGGFDAPTILHLTDTHIEVTRGDNSSKSEYGMFSVYVPMKDYIALLSQDVIATGFLRSDFADGGAEFIQRLEAAGVRRLRRWSLKRWGGTLIVFVLCLVITALCAWGLKNRTDDQKKFDAVMRGKCVSNLSSLTESLLAYSQKRKEAGDASFPQSLPWKEMIDAGCAKEEDWPINDCPLTWEEYILVPYGRTLDRRSANAASTPVLFDGCIGSHSRKSSVFFGKGIPQTLVAFEDGHVEILENLSSHQDIYEKFAPRMSKEDAEVLRKCCEAQARALK